MGLPSFCLGCWVARHRGGSALWLWVQTQIRIYPTFVSDPGRGRHHGLAPVDQTFPKHPGLGQGHPPSGGGSRCPGREPVVLQVLVQIGQIFLLLLRDGPVILVFQGELEKLLGQVPCFLSDFTL